MSIFNVGKQAIIKMVKFLPKEISRYVNRIWYGNDTILTKSGDVVQVLNPAIALLWAELGNDRNENHRELTSFASHLILVLQLSFMIKLLGKRLEFAIARRPSGAYNGMPSSHTVAAWVAAAYSRESINNQPMVLFMYSGAIITAYSRVRAGAHTVSQVVAAAVIAETCNNISKYVRNRC